MGAARLVELVRLPSRIEAEVLVAQLGSQGITATVFDGGSESFQMATMVVGVRVMVANDDLEEARAIVEDLLGSQ